MRFLIPVLFLSLMLSGTVHGTPSQSVSIPADISAVVVPVSPSPSELNAAQELAEHLSKASGTKISCVKESSSPALKNAIYVGRTRFAYSKKIDPHFMGQEEWLIRSFPDGVAIVGGGTCGTLYGAYEFLERFAGIVWVDERFTYIPPSDPVLLPEKIDLRGNPAFAYRGIYVCYSNHPERRIRFLSRSRENLFWEEKIPEKLSAAIGYTPVFGSPQPLNTLFFYVKEWPEMGYEDCYSLDEAGKRVRPIDIFGPGQICFSNPRAREKFAGQMIGYIEKDRKLNPDNPPLLYNLSVNDVKDICHCPECTARTQKYGSPSGGMLEFVNSVAEAVEKKYPDVRIQTSAYLSFEKAPSGGIVPRRNVTVRVSPSRWGSGFDTMRPLTLPRNLKTLETLHTWSSLGSIQIWNYWVLFGRNPDKNACLVNLEAIRSNLNTYLDNGADYVFSECEFPETTTFHALRVWIGYKLKCDPRQELAPLIARFMKACYGEAAPFMKEYYDLVSEAQKTAPELDTRGALERKYLNADFFRKAEGFIQSALNAVRNDPERTLRVLQERIPLDIARLLCCPDIPGFKPDAAEVAARLSRDWPEAARQTLAGGTLDKSLAQIHEFFRENSVRKPGARYPVPSELADKEIYEITATDFNQFEDLKFYGVRMNDDPEAAGGKAMGVDKSPRIADPEAFHAKAFNAGIRDRANSRMLLSAVIPKDRIPQDEKYHFYPLGTVKLEPSALLWLHETWYLQQELGIFFRKNAPEENRYRVYVSLKFTGPAYVKGSQKENAFWMDRILLVQAENPDSEKQSLKGKEQ